MADTFGELSETGRVLAAGFAGGSRNFKVTFNNKLNFIQTLKEEGMKDNHKKNQLPVQQVLFKKSL